MTVRLFDVQAGFEGPQRGRTETVTVGEYVEDMTRLDIGQAMVRIVPGDLIRDPVGANENSFLMGDLDQNGLIDGGDLAEWQQNYDPVGVGSMP